MITRRDSITGLLTALVAARQGWAAPLTKEGSAHKFSRGWLEEEAERLSKSEYRPAPEVPEGWRNLTYDQYRKMWFNPQRGLWMDEDRPFKVDFFHPGLYFPRPVEVNVVENGTARTLAFDLSLFDKTDRFPDLPVDETMGYSGLRLRGALERAGIYTEFAVFQGASYFRAIGAGMTYGLSARGLALGTADADGEEFPEFTRFWLEAPQPGDTAQIVHALLDGPSTTGAYRFRITPGPTCRIEVEAVLFPRRDLAHAGLAPLTSMFLFDQTNRHEHDDFRTAVHDSDGLMVHNGAGELLWRPLKNPRTLQVSSFVDSDPRGFGLMQRAREVEDYADLEAHYHERPSLWITPGEGWGPGAVTLVEIPSELEIYDNIVAYWRPREALALGQAHRFSYAMEWSDAPARPRDVAQVLNTRIGGNYDRTATVIAIDFADHPALRGDLSGLQRLIRSTRGTVSEGILQENPGTGGVRLSFTIDPGDATEMELRAQLLRDDVSVTEVWLYRWTA